MELYIPSPPHPPQGGGAAQRPRAPQPPRPSTSRRRRHGTARPGRTTAIAVGRHAKSGDVSNRLGQRGPSGIHDAAPTTTALECRSTRGYAHVSTWTAGVCPIWSATHCVPCICYGKNRPIRKMARPAPALPRARTGVLSTKNHAPRPNPTPPRHTCDKAPRQPRATTAPVGWR